MRNYVWSFVILVVIAGAAYPQAAAPLVDHFKCYTIQQTPLPFPPADGVTLQDQFDVAAGITETVRDLRPIRLCNPVDKFYRRRLTLRAHPEDHLMLFLMDPQPIVPRTVLVDNQFGRQELDVRDPQVLAVPTAKWLPGEAPQDPPTTLDHYKCYSASGKNLNQVVTLRDQFHTERVFVFEPIGFCNPVRKTHGTVNFGVINADVHLTCYTISPVPVTRTVFVDNQFIGDPVQLNVGAADILCVPSRKVKWENKPAGAAVAGFDAP